MKGPGVFIPALIILVMAGTISAQTIVCDGRICGGSGTVSYDAILRDFVYRVTTGAVPENPDSIFIGTHDDDLSHYSDICYPAGWSYAIIPGTRPDYSNPTNHGSVSPAPDGNCPYTFLFRNVSGAPLSSSTPTDFGFNYQGYPHNVDWTVAAFPPVSADWAAVVGVGAGPVHGPRCDTLCESGQVVSWFQPAGNSDNFSTADGPEPSSPSADLLALMQTLSAGADPFFDSNTMDRCFGHTFVGWDAHCCVIGAQLCFRITPIGSGCGNDIISIRENAVNATWGCYIKFLKAWNSGNPADTFWNVGDTLDICLDLANMPLIKRTEDYYWPPNILATLDDGDIDFLLADDTKIDFLTLTIQICTDCDTGACCLTDGSCVFAVGAADCDNISGGLGIFYPNAGCTPNPCGGNCVKPPPDLISWWPLNETSPSVANDIVSNRDGVHLNNPGFVTGKVGGAYRFTRLNGSGVVRVNDDPFDHIGNGDFTIDAWIYPEPWSTWCQNATCKTNRGHHPCEYRIIVDNRLQYNSPGVGFFAYMKETLPGYLGLEIREQGGTVEASFLTSSAPVLLNQWQHVAVTVSRTAGTPEITFYHNGTPYPATPTGPIPLGKLHAPSPPYARMDIGHGPSLNASSCCFTNEYFSGIIDEVQIFERALDLTEILAIYNAEEKGKCRSHCTLPKLVFCPNDANRTFTMMIYNESKFPVNYYWGIGSSPADCPSGVVSNYNTPFSFASSSPPNITIPAGGSYPISIVATKDPTFGVGDIACYSAWVLDPATGNMFFCRGSIHGVSYFYCPYVAGPYVGPPADLYVDSTMIAEFPITNTGDGSETFNYEIGVISSCAPDTFVIDSIISLNGLPPGENVIDDIFIPLDDSATVEVAVQLTEYKPFSIQEIVLRADWDDVGTMSDGPTIAIHPALLADCNNNGVEDSVDIDLGTSLDTNSNAIPDECEPYVWPDYCYFCGDANGDTTVNLGDAVFLINCVFREGSPAPDPLPAGDTNNDCAVNLGDAVVLVNYVFNNGDPPTCDAICEWR
jgi:hypothetical protein